MKVVLTGATGMVGEGVLFECLEHTEVSAVLVVGRKPYGLKHPKLKELIVPDFLKISEHTAELKAYDACFFCAGISSVGMKEDKFTQITYDTTMAFAKAFLNANPNAVFTYVSGRGTDSSASGKIMWARVKGKTENELTQLGFKAAYNFRPALMIPFKGQKSAKPSMKILASVLKYVMPKATLSLAEVGRAMINVVNNNYPKSILEVADIRKAATL